MKALLNDEGKKIWGYVFPGGEVPVTTIMPFTAHIEDLGNVDVYLVDWKDLGIDERNLILDHLMKKFRSSKEDIEKEISRAGMPLRANLVSAVSIDGRFF